MITGRIAILLALGASIGVVGAYLLAGGASYEPLDAADPCQPRSEAILEERGVFEGIVLSALDGAACELQVSREELTAALSDDASLEAFAAQYELTDEDVDNAVRAALLRAIDDAAAEGQLPGPTAEIARFIAENLPISAVLDIFRALPGDPSIADILQALQDAGVGFAEIEEFFDGGIQDFLPQLGLPDIELPDGFQLPDGLSLPDALDGLQLPDPDSLPGPEDLENAVPDEIRDALGLPPPGP